MPDLTIDGLAVSVPKGTTVIEAAEAVGIVIPRLCWHKGLGPAGACRLCAVMFLEGPVAGVHMSCMTQAADGMVVDTGHPEALAFRRQVMEWLMANHPHDCPVCDEGGACLLQDVTIASGQVIRRFPGAKRTFRDQDLGPFVQQEMNRCIHCYRCARFYQEVAGYRDFGPMQNANRVFFGRFADGRLESPFSGNIIDLCPTGALTDKTARYKARPWETERAPSVCPHCALGCATTVIARNRELVRIEARENPNVNGFFLCDRGRFSHGFQTRADRPRQARVDGRATGMNAALAEAAARLRATVEGHGPASVACLGSVRATLETQAALASLARAAGWLGPAHFVTATEARANRAALDATSPRRGRSLAQLGEADAIVCLGVSPLFDAPLLALALRRAAGRGAMVLVADPRPVSLPLAFTHLPVAPRLLPGVLAVLAAPEAEAPALARSRLPLAPELWPLLIAANQALARAGQPMLVFAPGLAPVLPTDGRFGLFPVPRGPNAAGAALIETAGTPGLAEVAAAVASGRVKALLAVETDPLATQPSLAGLLPGLEALVVLDHLPTATARAATILLPTTTLFESGGTLCNNEGRMQRALPATAVGEPVSREGKGGHPPRDFARPLAGTDPRPAHALLTDLAETLGHTEALPLLALAGLDNLGAPAVPPPDEAVPDGPGLAVVWTEALFGTDELGRHGVLLGQPAGPPDMGLHADDAPALGLADGDPALLALGDRLAAVTVRLSRDMARGVAVLPRRPELAGAPAVLGPCDLRRQEAP
jgi:NADH-quinone oxidoreductase subunit G